MSIYNHTLEEVLIDATRLPAYGVQMLRSEFPLVHTGMTLERNGVKATVLVRTVTTALAPYSANQPLECNGLQLVMWRDDRQESVQRNVRRADQIVDALESMHLELDAICPHKNATSGQAGMNNTRFHCPDCGGSWDRDCS